jgi:Uma2 family endonuclease
MSLARQRLTAQAYLEIERAALCRSEYLDGQMYLMAGTTRRHNLIVSNLGGELRAQLKSGPCEVYMTDMRVKVNATGLYTYPDVIVVCTEPRFEGDQEDTLLNPILIVEVLSPSTEAYDRGEKFAHYRRVASIVDYVLVAQDRMRVEHYRRQPNGDWLLTERSGQEILRLESLGCEVPLAEIYDKVGFQPTALRDVTSS